MSGVLAVLQGWLAAVERLAGRLPEAATQLRAGGWPAAALALAAGLALLLAGSRLGRILSASGAALVGWVGGGLVAPEVRGWIPAWLPPWVGAVALGLAGLLSPSVYPIALGLAPGALLGRQLSVGGKSWLGGVSGAVVLALLALWLQRLVLAATAALAGAALVAAALLALSGRFPFLLVLVRRPLLLLGLAGLLAVAGTAFQLGAGVERGRRARRRLEGIEGG